MIDNYQNILCKKALKDALITLVDIFKEDTKTYDEYIKKNKDAYELSERLGKNGWVTPFCLDYCFADYECDADGLAKTDLKKFEKECEKRNVVKEIISYIDKENFFNDNIYYERAKKYFGNKDYFITAMCLMPLLENIVKDIVPNDSIKIKNKEKYCKKNFEQIYCKIFNKKIHDRFSKSFFTLNVFPSLYSYMSVVFCTSEEEWNGNTYALKRDLIFHGKNIYTISEIDCIKLFNAVFVAKYVLKMLK